ncbi:MAG: hypothetical protein ACLP9L_07080 [Thermoguttaceae bacterium]
MSTTETAINGDPTTRLDAQLDKLDEQVQNLLRREDADPSTREKARMPEAPSLNPCLPPLAPPAPPRPSIGKRLFRPAVGIALVALAAWALLPLIFDLRSTQAVVNAPLITLRSPIDGTLKFLCPTISGANAGANRPLFKIVNTLANEDGLDNLKDERALLEARVASFRQQLQALADLQESLSASARKYQEARLRTLELECEGATAWLESARAVEKQRNSEKEQIVRLQGSSSVSNLDGGATLFAAEAAHHAVVQAQKGVENLKVQIRSLREGVQVGPGDGRNDIPYSTQRLHELSFRTEEVRAALQQDEAKLAQLDRHIRAETERLSRRARFTSTVPSESVVWRQHASGDTAIQADSPLLDLINPAEVFIDAVIDEHNLSCVKIGDTAHVRLPGSAKQWKAVVKQVFGQNLPWPDHLLAAKTVPTSKQEIHVILSFSEPLADATGGLSMPVGLPAQVTFVSTGEALRKLFSWGK